MGRRSEKFRYKIAQYRHDLPNPKKNEIVIVPEDNRLTSIPPYTGAGSLPAWWNKLPKGRGSLRRCQGTYDYVKLGAYVPLWTNVHIRPNINGSAYEVMLDPMDSFPFGVDGFSAETSTGCPIENVKSIESGQYIKLVTPWRFITAKGISLMSLPVSHEPDPNYSVVPGIVHSDYYHQINVVLNVHTKEPFTIEAGTPIMHLVPIERSVNTSQIVWGNESMKRFVMSSGLGEGHIVNQNDKSLTYRKLLRRADS